MTTFAINDKFSNSKQDLFNSKTVDYVPAYYILDSAIHDKFTVG